MRWRRSRPAVPLRERIETLFETERERLPLWLPVGVAGGVAAWYALPDSRAWTGFLLASGAVALLGLALERGGRAARAIGLFALAAALGCALVWARAERIGGPRLARPAIASVEARIVRVEPLPARAAVRLLLDPIAAPALPTRLRLTVAAQDAPAGLARGAIVAVRARLVPPPPAAVPGAYDYAATAWFQGIGASGRALAPVRIVAPASAGPADWLEDARAALSAHITAQLPGAAGGVADALATGDMGAIPRADADAFRRSGLAHLLSVSGLHLTAAVGTTMLIVLRLLALSRRLALRAPLLLIAAGAGALAGVAYTLLTGAEVPTVRSLIASLIVLVGLAAGREAMTLRLVAGGALIVLLLWPESAAGASFQLSFAAIMALVALHELPQVHAVFMKRDEGVGWRAARTAGELLLTGAVVELALAPIAIFHFHRAGLYGAIANILAIPLTTFVIMPAEALALLFDIAGLGAPFWWVTGRSLALLLWLAHRVGSLPGAVTLVPTMSRGAFALIVAGGLWLALWRTRWRLAGLAPIALGVALTLLARPADLYITGDGRHVALRAPDGQVALLRERTGDYVRDALSELEGREGGDAVAFDDLPEAACGPDTCLAPIARGGRTWRLLATRSAYPIDRDALAPACAAADIVVSDRRLPGWCRPRWLKADLTLLRQTGGLAVRLDPPAIASVARDEGGHPWATAGLAPPPRHFASVSRRESLYTRHGNIP
ncbi:MAG TPA: ComEC/Rec2 family competence protein [Sphingomonas sp.]